MRTVGHHERDDEFGRVVEDLAAADAPLDRLGRSAVSGQVGAPLIPHSVQQPQAPGRVLHPHEADRPGVVWRGCRERFGDGGLEEVGRHGLGTESADRSAEQLRLTAAEGECFLGPEPEQVLFAGPQQRARVGTIVGQRESAHHGHRDIGQLALDQVGRRGDFVGDGDLGDDQVVAVSVL